MTFNAALARETLAFIKQLPSADEVEAAPPGAFGHDTQVWAQGDWHADIYNDGDGEPCGTGMCFAGWLAYNAGYKRMTNGSCRKTDNASWLTISEVADELLGLEDVDHNLYRGSNELADLEAEIDLLEREQRERERQARDDVGY
jgi:hypothetical protein